MCGGWQARGKGGERVSRREAGQLCSEGGGYLEWRSTLCQVRAGAGARPVDCCVGWWMGEMWVLFGREDCDGDSPTVENERGSPQVRGCERQVMKQERKGERTLGVPAAPARGVKSQGKGQSGFGGASGYVQPGGRSHSAPSQASSSENVCSCCHATSDCQVLSMAQQIARIVGVLAQAWGYSEETQRYAPVHQPCNPNQPMSINSVHKLGAAQVRSEELHSSTNFETQHKKNDHKEVSQRRDQCNDEHTSEVAMVLRKSHHQLMLMVQQMGMTIEPNTATPWNFWPQSWSAHPGPVADWRQWCNFTGAGAHTNKETMHVYSGNYGALVPSTIYRTTVQSPPVATGGAPSLYGMQTIPEVDAPGIPLFPTDGLQFAHTESNGRTTAKIPYSPEHNITLVEAKNMIHEAPVPHSLSLPLSGKKRGRSPEGIRGNRRGSARRRKMVRFTTPDKYCGMLEAKDDVDAQRDPSRRVDEIMVAEVLVCMSMSCF